MPLVPKLRRQPVRYAVQHDQIVRPIRGPHVQPDLLVGAPVVVAVEIQDRLASVAHALHVVRYTRAVGVV